jgi:flavin reductase (DIM6/NTAB) family NADH-FMN oxidoreductase RutF
MILDPAQERPSDVYRLLLDVVVPRPIAFVSTVGAGGRFNVAPFSFFNMITGRPPLLGVSIGRRGEGIKDTLRNVRAGGDFVVNVVDEALHARAVHASGEWPEEVDEFELTGLTPAPSVAVRAPRVAESPVNLECALRQVIELGAAHLVVGQVVRIHVREGLLREGRVPPLELKPVGRLGGDAYALVRQVVEIPRPKAARKEG